MQTSSNTSGSPLKKGWLKYAVVGTIGLLIIGGLAWSMFGKPNQGKQSSQNTQTNTAETPALNVEISNLTEGQEVSGTVVITAGIDVPSRAKRAELFIDDIFMYVSYAAPFTFSFGTNKLAAGEHKVYIKVYDEAGRSSTSKTIKIVVKFTIAVGEGSSTPSPSPTPAKKTTTPSPSPSPTSPSPSPTPPPPDTTPPTAPSNLQLAADDGYTSNLSWTASTDGVGVTSYNIFRDSTLIGTSTTNSYQDQTVVPGNSYNYYVNAVDAASNVSDSSNTPSITMELTSVWSDLDIPANIDSDPSAIEIGFKFKPLVNGKITGVRFYKGAGNTGTHVGKLWSAGGSSLATATFSGETATGWQIVSFSTPVDVVANTTYVASYNAPNGHISYTSGYFSSEGMTSQYLKALANGEDGGNGVFNGTAGSFPSSTFGSTNYWIDVLFQPNAAAGGPAVKTVDNTTVYTGHPGTNNTGIPIGRRLPARSRGFTVTTPSVTIKNFDITGDIIVQANNVTVQNVKVTGRVLLDVNNPSSSGWSLLIEDSEINASTSGFPAISSAHITMNRSNIHGGVTAMECYSDCSVNDSYLYSPIGPGTGRNLAFYSGGGNDMILTGNTIECKTPINGLGGGCLNNLQLENTYAANTNVTIDANFFPAYNGIQYCVDLGNEVAGTYTGTMANIIVTNNVFQRGATNLCGTIASVANYLYNGGGAPPTGGVWTNNKWDDGTTINPNGL